MEVSFCKTISFDFEQFQYQTISQENGRAVTIKFSIDEKSYSPGDVVVVLKGSDIVFHGMIRNIENGLALASDPRGSSLPVKNLIP
jgi:hypothetical protein